MGVFNTFKDGELVPASGVYLALHTTPHRLIERATYDEGANFNHVGCVLWVFCTGWTNRSFPYPRNPQVPRLLKEEPVAL